MGTDTSGGRSEPMDDDQVARKQKPGALQMSSEDMLDLAQKAAEILVKRIEGLPGDLAWDGDFQQPLADKLNEDPPEEGRPADEVIEQATRDILPFAARLDHPRCFAFIPSSPTWPGVLADFMAAGYNFNSCNWLCASGPSEVELVVIDWLRSWIGYPESAGGLLTSGGSAAIVDAFVAAREAAGNPNRSTVYMSNQSHKAQVRAARIVGVQSDRIRLLPVNDHFQMDIETLARAVTDDRAAGYNPIMVCANAGAPSTGSIDPLKAMADFCEEEGIWLHADAAYGGFAVVAEKGKALLSGIERADSINLDAHKWFFQPYEAGCLLVKDVERLERVFEVHQDVLQDTIWGANHPNFSDRGLQLSRSARALKIWMSVQTFGMAAFREAVTNGMDLAVRADAYINQSPVLESLNPASLGIVCFRVNPTHSDTGSNLEEEDLTEINRKVLARVFWEDRALMSSTTLGETFSLRLCIINHNTTWDDVHQTLEAVERFGKDALKKGKKAPRK